MILEKISHCEKNIRYHIFFKALTAVSVVKVKKIHIFNKFEGQKRRKTENVNKINPL